MSDEDENGFVIAAVTLACLFIVSLCAVVYHTWR